MTGQNLTASIQGLWFPGHDKICEILFDGPVEQRTSPSVPRRRTMFTAVSLACSDDRSVSLLPARSFDLRHPVTAGVSRSPRGMTFVGAFAPSESAESVHPDFLPGCSSKANPPRGGDAKPWVLMYEIARPPKTCRQSLEEGEHHALQRRRTVMRFAVRPNG